MAVEIEIETQGEIRILGLIGRLDSETAADVELAFADLLSAGATEFVVDLGRIGYVSSAGLRVLLALAKKLDHGKGHLYLCGLSPAVRQVFDVAGFSKLFALFAERGAALKKAGKTAPAKHEGVKFGAEKALAPKDVLAALVTNLLGVTMKPWTVNPKAAVLARSAALLLGIQSDRSGQVTKPPVRRAAPAKANAIAPAAPAATSWIDKVRALFGGKR